MEIAASSSLKIRERDSTVTRLRQQLEQAQTNATGTGTVTIYLLLSVYVDVPHNDICVCNATMQSNSKLVHSVKMRVLEPSCMFWSMPTLSPAHGRSYPRNSFMFWRSQILRFVLFQVIASGVLLNIYHPGRWFHILPSFSISNTNKGCSTTVLGCYKMQAGPAQWWRLKRQWTAEWLVS